MPAFDGPVCNYTWNNLTVGEYCYPPMEVCQQNHDGHRVVINLGEALRVKWKQGNVWRQKIYEHGAIGILPYGNVNEVAWEQQLQVLVISLSHQFTNNVLEVSNAEFNEKRGVVDYAVRKISAELRREMKNYFYTSNLYGDLLAIELALHLGSSCMASPKPFFAPGGKLSSAQLRNTTDYLQTYLDQNIRLKDLADQSCLSPFHFSRLFKNTTGMPPHRFANHLKVERAKLMIKKRQYRLTEIACMLGYADDAHFINAFKKYTGYRPADYATS